ncbi:MAG: glycosyltransferase family 4 protein [Bacteroidota bacterium]|jgi:glycosyltransferase involved in cell wall biosynthesis
MKVAILANYPIAPFVQANASSWPNEHPYPWVKNLAEGLAEIGVEVSVVALRRDVVAPVVYERCKVKYHFVPYANKILRKLFPLEAPRRTILRYLRMLKPDIVHVQGAGIYSHAMFGSSFPVVVTIHGIASDYPAHLAQANDLDVLLEREAVTNSEHVISISPYVSDWLKNNGYRGALYDVENPVDPLFFSAASEKENSAGSTPGTNILFVGGLTPRKRIEDAILVTSRITDAHLHIVSQLSSSSDYKRHVVDLIEEHGMVNRVIWHKYLEPHGLVILMKRSSCLLLTSEAETAPMVVAEAMAAGLPVVATKVGGIPHMIQNGVTGFLTDVGDVERMTECIEQLTNRDAGQMLIKSAQKVALERNHYLSVARKTKDVYEKL